MSEYIEREALIAEFKRLMLGEGSLIERVFADGVYAVLETFPAADVQEVRHGKWIGSRYNEWNNNEYEEKCSICGRYSTEYGKSFCPNCGAKMDKE